VAERQPALERLFPDRAILRGRSLTGLLVSVLAALVLGGILLFAWLLLDLLSTRGQLGDSAAASLAEVYTVEVEVVEPPPAGEPEQGEPAAGKPAAADAEPAAIVVVPADWARPGANRGLLPTVARLRSQNTLGAGLLTSLVAALPALRTNTSAMVTLLVGGVLLAILWAILVRAALARCRAAASEVTTRLRRSLHRHALRLGPSDLRDREGATVLHLFTAEVGTVGEGIREWTNRVGRHVCELVVLLAVALLVDWRLTLQCLLPLAGCWYLVHHEFRRRAERRRLGMQQAGEDLRRLAESLHNTRLVRGFGMENFEHEQFGKHLDRYQRDVLAVERGEATTLWAVRVLVAASLGLVFLLVGWKVLAAPEEWSLSLSGAIVLLVAFGWMYQPLERLGEVPALRQRARIAAESVQRYLDEIPEVSQAVGAKFLEPLSRELRFEAVTYRARTGDLLLDELDITIRAGDVVALVSMDPLEARAAAYLLPRFIEPASGRVVIDGEDVAWVTLESLRAETIFVGAGDTFFTGTVHENVSCGSPEIGKPEITTATKTVHAHNFIQRLPHGYETVLGEHGEQLDPGRAFRLGLARAIVRNPALLIVEEPDAPLDTDTKSLLDDAYDRIFADRTCILLPARLSTLRRATRVIVLQNGKVVADGHHADLVKSSALYRHWEYMRFNEFTRV
jgi:ATP-binding cassette, subfamily B, bacterial